MFKGKKKIPNNINPRQSKEIDLNQLAIGKFWSRKRKNGTGFSESLSIDELKLVANEYEDLVHDHAELTHFKEVALKHITKDQLEAIEEEMENIPETEY